jgi:hypothetical protein
MPNTSVFLFLFDNDLLREDTPEDVYTTPRH